MENRKQIFYVTFRDAIKVAEENVAAQYSRAVTLTPLSAEIGNRKPDKCPMR
jgi:hypothetical protein